MCFITICAWIYMHTSGNNLDPATWPVHCKRTFLALHISVSSNLVTYLQKLIFYSQQLNKQKNKQTNKQNKQKTKLRIQWTKFLIQCYWCAYYISAIQASSKTKLAKVNQVPHCDWLPNWMASSCIIIFWCSLLTIK